ncbi:MAG: hypothetical protein JJV97_00445 [SAR324 cluster bacterium]|nr:hypothetical protein [SAR324 cluster bacterium]
MLHFSGIEYKNGVPTRFSFNIPLLDSFKKATGLLENSDNDPKAALAKIKDSIEFLFTNSRSNFSLTPQIRQKARNLYLQRDIILFLQNNQARLPALVQLLTILYSISDIKTKWQLVVGLLVDNKIKLARPDFLDKLFNEESLLYSILQIVRLSFLAQIGDRPPPNLKLILVAKSFPQHNWISYEFGEHKRIINWQTDEVLCTTSYLQHSLWEALVFEKEPKSRLASQQFFAPSLVNYTKKNLVQEKSEEINQSSIEQENEEFSLTGLDWRDQQQEKTQLKLIPEKPWESFYEFQNYLQKKHSIKGVVAFYGILRQFLPARGGVVKSFNVRNHLELLNENLRKASQVNSVKKSKTLKDPKKSKRWLAREEANWKKTQMIFNELANFDVIRQREENGELKRYKLLVVMGKTFADDKEIVPQTMDIFLDKVFSGNNKLGYLPLAIPYLLIPKDFFTLKIPVSLKEVINLMIYLTTNWLYEYNFKGGVLTQNISNIISGSRLYFSKSAQYRAVYKTLSAIRFMKEKGLIADYHLQKGETKSPWATICQLKANSESLQLLAEINHKKVTHKISA